MFIGTLFDSGRGGCQNPFLNGERAQFLWRRPGRRDEERKRFAALMRNVEAVRLRYGMTKTELAAELGANVDGVSAWMSGRTIGRKETVERIKRFLGLR
jgi:ribosome-binding protein aMBF1 (putative translation factor)